MGIGDGKKTDKVETKANSSSRLDAQSDKISARAVAEIGGNLGFSL